MVIFKSFMLVVIDLILVVIFQSLCVCIVFGAELVINFEKWDNCC